MVKPAPSVYSSQRMALNSDNDLDTRMMALALTMAERGLGTTAPNPSVGAVIVDQATGDVIAEGWTQPGGRPHAETEAIRHAGARARGATIYVTLEPCSHYGKTPPCAEGIIAAGLTRVVCGILDPDPRVSGRGLRMLRAAGIAVERGVLGNEAHWITRGHILRVTERRPFIQLKMAFDSDGTIPRGHAGQPVWATGPEARAHGHLLRARADAILVGAGTVADDDPELTCRLPGLESRSPIRIVLAGRRLPSLSSKLVRSVGAHPVWVYHSPEAPSDGVDALAAAGCRTTVVPMVAGRLWLPAVMESLVAAGITRLLVEGGEAVWRSFCAAGLVDEVLQYRAPPPWGGRCDASVAARDLARMAVGLEFSLTHEQPVGADMHYAFRRK